jgi:hypothetical protein
MCCFCTKFSFITSKIEEIFQEAKVIAPFHGCPVSDSSVIKNPTKKGNHVTFYGTVP